MTITTMPTPIPVTTTSGSPLPLVALPHGELLTVNVSDVPLIRDAFGEGVHVQPLRIDLEAGEWVVLATLSPGAELPIHYHTGTAEGYTLSGSWHYKEYPDQVQTAGSYLYEPGGSVHTFVCPETNTEDTVVFIKVEGANVNFNEDGSFHSILDAVLLQMLVQQLSEAQGVGPVSYIGGGSAGFTSTQA